MTQYLKLTWDGDNGEGIVRSAPSWSAEMEAALKGDWVLLADALQDWRWALDQVYNLILRFDIPVDARREMIAVAMAGDCEEFNRLMAPYPAYREDSADAETRLDA